MSTAAIEVKDNVEKFTRGEKCIFFHLVATFCLILILIIIYFVHLCLVKHNAQDVWRISRISYDNAKRPVEKQMMQYPMGLIFLASAPPKSVCNTLLLKYNWSLGPGHCVAMRNEPDLSHLLQYWRVKYKNGENFQESKIKRSLPHPRFDRSDFSNDVGLIEHESSIFIVNPYVLSTAPQMSDDTLQTNSNALVIIGWKHNSNFAAADSKRDKSDLQHYDVEPVATRNCTEFMAPIVNLRPYEFCVIMDDSKFAAGDYPDHGAVLAVNEKLLGMFAWGERTVTGIPFIIIDITHYKDWVQNVIFW